MTSAGAASTCDSVYTRFPWMGNRSGILCHDVTQPSEMQHLGIQIKSLFLQLLPLPSCPVGLLWYMWSVCALCQRQIYCHGWAEWRKVKGLHVTATITVTTSSPDHPYFPPGFGMFLRKHYPGSPLASDHFQIPGGVVVRETWVTPCSHHISECCR